MLNQNIPLIVFDVKDFYIDYKARRLRPFAKGFFNYVFQSYNVGIWSNFDKNQTQKMLMKTFNNVQLSMLSFVIDKTNLNFNQERAYFLDDTTLIKSIDYILKLPIYGIQNLKDKIMIIDNMESFPLNIQINPVDKLFVLSNYTTKTELVIKHLISYLKYKRKNFQLNSKIFYEKTNISLFTKRLI